MIQFNEAEKLLQQLPVAFYLKRKLDVKLDYANTSYIDIYNNKLVVSYNQLANLSTADEKDVRCCLYHEVSHAFLTPLKLSMNDIINIFEDERIETICKNYYLDTDFKSFCFKTNNYNGQLPKDEHQLFYQIVRFRKGPQQFVDRVDEIIAKHAKLNRDSSYTCCNEYYDDIIAFWNEIVAYWNQLQKLNEESLSDNQNEDDNINQDETTSQNTCQNKETTSKKDAQSNQSNNENVQKNQFDTQSAIDDAIKNLDSQFNALIDENFQASINQILFSKAKSTKMNGSAINAYSGVFDPRSVGRQDYKYFVQKNRAGNVKRFSKIKLNLFIDDSGSFKSSEDVVNKMLYNLVQLEKKTTDFEFDVVVMDVGEKLLKKNARKISCRDCNMLDKNIFKLFDSVQSKNATNINIVMFDGFAFSNITWLSYSSRTKLYNENRSNFKAFNKANTIIISSQSNERDINEFCPSAKKIIENKNYAQLLINNIVNNLSHALK